MGLAKEMPDATAAAAAEAQGFAIEANHLKGAKGAKTKGGAAAAAGTGAGGKKKNVLGLDFDIPDELSQLLSQEMKKQGDMP